MAQKHDILYVNFYTDGSAARKLAPAFPAAQPRKGGSAKRKKKTVIFLDPVAVCSLMVAAVMLIMMAVGLNEFQNARAEAQAMEAYVSRLGAENERLSTSYREKVDLQEIEETALALGMVPKDQVRSVSIRVELPQEQVAPVTLWDQVTSFLTNLFA